MNYNIFCNDAPLVLPECPSSAGDQEKLFHMITNHVSIDEIESVISSGIDLEFCNKEGNTALLLSAKFQNDKACSLLIDYGANIHAQDENGDTALHHFAKKSFHSHVGERLIKKGADMDKCNLSGYTSFHYALENAWDNFNSTQIEICEYGVDDSLAQHMFNNKASLALTTPDNETPLHLAIEYKLWDLAESMVNNGADPNAVDYTNKTPLHLAAEHGLIELTRKLLHKKANPNARDQYKRSPLHLAAINQFREVSRVLLVHDASPNLQDFKGDTPLHIWGRQADKQWTSWVMLKQYKADSSIRNQQNKKPKLQHKLHFLKKLLPCHKPNKNKNTSIISFLNQ